MIELLIELYSNDAIRYGFWELLGSGGDVLIDAIEALGFEVWEDYSISRD